MAGDINEIYTGSPNNREWRGSYLGFTFNGVHSSDLGIVRTSSGSRYNDDLLPTTTDKTVEGTRRRRDLLLWFVLYSKTIYNRFCF